MFLKISNDVSNCDAAMKLLLRRTYVRPVSYCARSHFISRLANYHISILFQYAHFTNVAPQVNPPPKAAKTILSPLFNCCLQSQRQSGIVAAVVLP